jgi:SAM-dependent methyltransferase
MVRKFHELNPASVGQDAGEDNGTHGKSTAIAGTVPGFTIHPLSIADPMSEIQHLPKSIDLSTDRNHFYETHWKQAALELLAHHGGPLGGLSLLDYGCGRGETLRLARDIGMNALGTDPDDECVALSQMHGNVTKLEDPHEPVRQFGEKSFDVVTCFHVLEHVDRPKEVLQSLGRISRRYLVVAVPNLRSLPKPRFFRHEPVQINEGHLQGWDHPHFRNLAERHCELKLIAWGHDHVRLPLFSELLKKIGGDHLAIRMETGAFLRCFPFHCTSIIALLEVKPQQ